VNNTSYDQGEADLRELAELALSSRQRYETVLARNPTDVELQSDATAPLYTLWQVESETGNGPAALTARWTYDARYLAHIQPLATAFSKNPRWQMRLRDAYARMIFQFAQSAERPDWNTLGRPEVAEAFLKLAAMVAHFPDGVSDDLTGFTLPYRQTVGKLLREFDAKGLLPPEQKHLIARIPMGP
jgi:hypothetical protein